MKWLGCGNSTKEGEFESGRLTKERDINNPYFVTKALFASFGGEGRGRLRKKWMSKWKK